MIDKINLARDYTYIGIVSHYIDNLDDALDNYISALSLDTEINDKINMVRDCISISLLRYEMGSHYDALAVLFEAKRLLEDYTDNADYRDALNEEIDLMIFQLQK
jgi:tetratricopeptide (TPR) repeat protein